jgi:hypothetical protein
MVSAATAVTGDGALPGAGRPHATRVSSTTEALINRIMLCMHRVFCSTTMENSGWYKSICRVGEKGDLSVDSGVIVRTLLCALGFALAFLPERGTVNRAQDRGGVSTQRSQPAPEATTAVARPVSTALPRAGGRSSTHGSTTPEAISSSGRRQRLATPSAPTRVYHALSRRAELSYEATGPPPRG